MNTKLDSVRGGLIAIAVFLVAWLVAPVSVHAAPTFTVNSAADVVDGNPGDGVCETAPGNGVCTLRAAIMEANHTVGGGATINFSLPNGSVILLSIPASGADDETTGALKINVSMSIVGNGAANTIVNGNGNVVNDPGLDIASGVTVNLSGVQIELAGTANTQGGAILNQGTLILTGSILRKNTSYNGGGILNKGNLSVVNSTIEGNNVYLSAGGGILNDYVLPAATLYMLDSTVTGNTAPTYGGGIYNHGNMTVVNSTISENSTPGWGGGIYGGGGAFQSTASLFNVTITDNRADADLNGTGTGGGIFNEANSTISFENTILAGNSESASSPGGFIAVIGECAGTLTSVGYNLLQNYDASHCTIDGSILPLANPNLGALANNGGPTWTHALLAGSPAINAGNPSGCTDDVGKLLTADQRGAPRPFPAGGTCDTGAYEYGATIPQTITFGALPNKKPTDPPFTVTATASSGLAVTFSSAGQCTVSGSTVTLEGAGSCTITAHQAGNANYAPAPNVSQSFSINAGADRIYLPLITR